MSVKEDRICIYIDESGDCGFKLGKGSTDCFCLAAVICRCEEHRNAIETVIQELKEQLSIRQTYEFHFVKESHKRRVRFCEAVAESPFTVRAVHVDKARINRDAVIRNNPKIFYSSVAGRLFDGADSLADCHVYVDGEMDRDLRTAIRKELNEKQKIARQIKPLDSGSNSLIQLADMAAGSICRSYKTEGPDCLDLRTILTPRIEIVRMIPEIIKGQLLARS